MLKEASALGVTRCVAGGTVDGLRDFCVTQSCIVVLYPACVTTGVPASS
jgi:hypothetical protein